MTARERWIVLFAVVACLVVGTVSAIVTHGQCKGCWEFQNSFLKHNTCTGDSYRYNDGKWELR